MAHVWSRYTRCRNALCHSLASEVVKLKTTRNHLPARVEPFAVRSGFVCVHTSVFVFGLTHSRELAVKFAAHRSERETVFGEHSE